MFRVADGVSMENVFTTVVIPVNDSPVMRDPVPDRYTDLVLLGVRKQLGRFQSGDRVSLLVSHPSNPLVRGDGIHVTH